MDQDSTTLSLSIMIYVDYIKLLSSPIITCKQPHTHILTKTALPPTSTSTYQRQFKFFFFYLHIFFSFFCPSLTLIHLLPPISTVNFNPPLLPETLIKTTLSLSQLMDKVLEMKEQMEVMGKEHKEEVDLLRAQVWGVDVVNYFYHIPPLYHPTFHHFTIPHPTHLTIHPSPSHNS